MDEMTPEIIQSENLIVLEDNHADLHDKEIILDENTIILAAGDIYSMIDMPYLISAVHATNKSYEYIAEEQNISVSSIYKLLTYKSKSPSFYNVVKLCISAGVSLDILCGICPQKPSAPDTQAETLARLCETISTLQKTVESQSHLIQQLTAELHRISPASSEDY